MYFYLKSTNVFLEYADLCFDFFINIKYNNCIIIFLNINLSLVPLEAFHIF